MESSLSHRGNKNLTDVLSRFPPYLLNPNFTWHGIDLTLAENHVIRSEILSILKTCIGEGLSSQHLDWPKGLCGYPPLLDALATTFNRYFKPYTPIESDHLAVTPGTSAGLDILLYHLCDPEDGVLVPCPYWSGYDTFFTVRSQVQIIGVEVPELEDSFHDIALISALEKHYKEAKYPIKAVVLSHPHNPLGRPYPPHVLKQCMAFCRDHNLHLISDEVFALSTFTSPDLQNWAAFKSVLSIDPSTVGLDPSRVHVLWSMSKDLAASGIRLRQVCAFVNEVDPSGMHSNPKQSPPTHRWPSRGYPSVSPLHNQSNSHSDIFPSPGNTKAELHGSHGGILYRDRSVSSYWYYIRSGDRGSVPDGSIGSASSDAGG
ncbi:hypothetical protein AtubIFM55763_010944 [Aspergillus tubingensis]|nr:hypothetical protein AtubIFM55763_010944 [Aspergillus tubingensis]